jgi:hypothetical protein
MEGGNKGNEKQRKIDKCRGTKKERRKDRGG